MIAECTCNWLEGSGTEPCGCGKHDCRLYREAVAHYGGKHWLYSCLVSKFEREREELRAVLDALLWCPDLNLDELEDDTREACDRARKVLDDIFSTTEEQMS